MGVLRTLVPISRAGLAWWAFRHRNELLSWGSFGVRAVPRLVSGDAGDLVTETRLRLALAGDPSTKRARELAVTVRDGVAELRGVVDAETALAATRVAERTQGVRRVLDATAASRARRWRVAAT